jgi:hypothetical protein
MMHTTDCLGEEPADLQNFQLGTQTGVVVLRNAVGYNNLVKCGGIDTGNGIATEYAMGEQGVHLGCALLFQQFCSAGDCIGGIGQVINKNADFFRNISHEHHSGILSVCDTGGTTFLKGK